MLSAPENHNVKKVLCALTYVIILWKCCRPPQQHKVTVNNIVAETLKTLWLNVSPPGQTAKVKMSFGEIRCSSTKTKDKHRGDACTSSRLTNNEASAISTGRKRQVKSYEVPMKLFKVWEQIQFCHILWPPCNFSHPWLVTQNIDFTFKETIHSVLSAQKVLVIVHQDLLINKKNKSSSL